MNGGRASSDAAGAGAHRRRLLTELYGDEAERLGDQVEQLLSRHRSPAPRSELWTEHDAWLITYPDQFHRSGQAPLTTLRDVMSEHLSPELTGVHVTPFFPWTSDDGFAVTDYLSVDQRYGTWDDVEALARSRRLVVDAVINHMSASSDWFIGFLAGDPEYAGFFRTADPDADLAATARPRATPLLTRFEGHAGPVWVWTTFSPDQVDLDYRTPRVLLKVLEVLLAYLRRGASVLRLDAVGYVWKQEGTSSLNLPQTHALVQLLRSCLESADPTVLLLTETNVPSDENLAYLGSEGVDEAHLVYQFPLPVLTLDALAMGDATRLRSWLAALPPPRPGTSYLNFLASHDGVGMRPAEGRLDDERIAALADLAVQSGGRLSERTLADGRTAVYELNATWYSLMRAGHSSADGLDRHLASHAVMLALQGIPALYVHSLVASENDLARLERTGQLRAVNRGRFPDVAAFASDLADPSTRAGAAWRGLRQMLRWRTSTPAFSPDSRQTLLDAPPQVLAVERTARSGERARVLVNVSSSPVTAQGPPDDGWSTAAGSPLAPGRAVELPAWSSLWLRAP